MHLWVEPLFVLVFKLAMHQENNIFLELMESIESTREARFTWARDAKNSLVLLSLYQISLVLAQPAQPSWYDKIYNTF